MIRKARSHVPSLLKKCGTTLRVVNDIIDSHTFRTDCDAERRTTQFFNRLFPSWFGRAACRVRYGTWNDDAVLA